MAPIISTETLDGEELAALALVFAEWERRYREEPEAFESDFARIVRGVSEEDYGVGAAFYFAALVDELAPDEDSTDPRLEDLVDRVVAALEAQAGDEVEDDA